MSKVFVILLMVTIKSETVRNAILNALERAVNFVHEDYQNLNVDGVFCLALAEANLEMATKKGSHRLKLVLRKVAETRELSLRLLPEEPFKYWACKSTKSSPRMTSIVCSQAPSFHPFDLEEGNRLRIQKVGPFRPDDSRGVHRLHA